MSKIDEDNTSEVPTPEDLIGTFSACSNFPRERGDRLLLAQRLRAVADETGVSAEDIVRRCADSVYCPGPGELLVAARAIKREAEVARGEYDTLAADASNANARPGCAACGNTGWRIEYTLYTLGSGGLRRAKRETITAEVAAQIEAKLPENQRVYSGARRCNCRTETA